MWIEKENQYMMLRLNYGCIMDARGAKLSWKLMPSHITALRFIKFPQQLFLNGATFISCLL